MKITRTHICFEVTHLENSLKFYAPIMAAAGFKSTIHAEMRYAFFDNESIGFAIGESNPRRVTRNKPTGNEFVVTDHIGFSVDNKDDLSILDKVAKENNIMPLFPLAEYPEFGKEFYSICFCDLDNNVIEFCHK